MVTTTLTIHLECDRLITFKRYFKEAPPGAFFPREGWIFNQISPRADGYLLRYNSAMTHGYRIRPYQPSDIARLQEITAMTFGPVSIDQNMEKLFGPFGEGDWSTRKAVNIADDCRLQPDGVFVVIDPSDVVVGYVTTRLNSLSKIGWIPNLAVDPSQQGHGLGRALLDYAIDFFRRSGMQVAKIETLEQNPVGQKLYPKLGFKEIARQVHFGMKL